MNKDKLRSIGRLRAARDAQPNIPPIKAEGWRAVASQSNPDLPIVYTTGNLGYADLVINQIRHLKATGFDQWNNYVVFTFDRKLKKALSTWEFVHVVCLRSSAFQRLLKKDSSNAVQFKKGNWNTITMFKLLCTWFVTVVEHRVAFYFDPDVVFLRNPLETLPASASLQLQKGSPYCSGIVWCDDEELADLFFNPKWWVGVVQDDDETYLNEHITYLIQEGTIGPIQTLPFGKYPNGLIWCQSHNDSDRKREWNTFKTEHDPIVMHFNHLAGTERKMKTMEQCGLWITPLRSMETLISPLNRLVSNAPPTLERRFWENTRDLRSTMDFLFVEWTELASLMKKNPRRAREWRKKLQAWCRRVISPDRRYFTIVQHCKGVYGSTGIVLPNNVRIIGTSDPTAATRLEYNNNTDQIRRPNITIPLLPRQTISLCDERRDVFLSFQGRFDTHRIRRDMLKVFEKSNGVVIRRSGAHSDYVKLLQRSVFALCPRGFGNTSFRLWESLQAGAIPVYIGDVYSLPLGFPADELCILCHPNEMKDLEKRLRAISSERIAEYQQAIRKHRTKWCTVDGMVSYICTHIAGSFRI